MRTSKFTRRYTESIEHHPTADCVDFMRRELSEDASDLSIITNLDREVPLLRKQFAKATTDSGTPFPSMQDFREENWGAWQKALQSQIENASRGQIVDYFTQKHGVWTAKDCPVCEGRR